MLGNRPACKSFQHLSVLSRLAELAENILDCDTKRGAAQATEALKAPKLALGDLLGNLKAHVSDVTKAVQASHTALDKKRKGAPVPTGGSDAQLSRRMRTRNLFDLVAGTPRCIQIPEIHLSNGPRDIDWGKPTIVRMAADEKWFSAEHPLRSFAETWVFNKTKDPKARVSFATKLQFTLLLPNDPPGPSRGFSRTSEIF